MSTKTTIQLTTRPEVEAEAEEEYAGVAAFASAESQEILSLLAESDAAGSCCGGSCGCGAQ